MADTRAQEAAFEFLKQRLVDREPFSMRDLGEVTGWKRATLSTYLSKQLQPYLTKLPDGNFRVKRTFKKFGTFTTIRPLVTQVRRAFAPYTRTTYDAVVGFEFLLPLTHEGKLRTALDELFYRDTIEALVLDLDEEGRLDGALRRIDGEQWKEYIERAIAKVGDLFTGYSISHVSGRFRAASIATRREAAQFMEKDQRYLVDETTAVVRFIFPCQTSQKVHGTRFNFEVHESPSTPISEATKEEISTIRSLFFAVFVDAILRSVPGEDIIWLLEESLLGHRLYELGHAEEEDGKDQKEEEMDETNSDSRTDI